MLNSQQAWWCWKRDCAFSTSLYTVCSSHFSQLETPTELNAVFSEMPPYAVSLATYCEVECNFTSSPRLHPLSLAFGSETLPISWCCTLLIVRQQPVFGLELYVESVSVQRTLSSSSYSTPSHRHDCGICNWFRAPEAVRSMCSAISIFWPRHGARPSGNLRAFHPNKARYPNIRP
jgi:hypothetical protein